MRLTLPVKSWEYQTPIQDLQNPPTLNTWYTVCDLSGGVMLRMITLYQTNTETNAKNIEIEIIIDGVTVTMTEALADSTVETLVEATPLTSPPEFIWGLGVAQMASQSDIAGVVSTNATIGVTMCHDFRLRYRITSALGTAQTIGMYVAYSLLRPVT